MTRVRKSTPIQRDNSTRIPWTSSEIQEIVEDYLEMLQIELAGGCVVKAERNRKLRLRIERSRGSIEYKHQNISAVMADFGLPFIWGYKPAVNYQRALYKIMKEFLVRNNLHLRLANIENINRIINKNTIENLTYQPVPNLKEEMHRDYPDIRKILSEFDPATRDAKLKSLGDAGEEFVLYAERYRLSAIGRTDLSSKVRWIAKDVGDGEGFDILSFSEKGEERWLEVKTTNGPATTPFWISENEWQVSENHRDKFRLTRLYHFTQKPKVFQLVPPLTDHVRLNPTNYRAVF